MARFDLNRDGKKDIFDSMIEYEIYKDVMGEDDEITPSSFSRKKYLENHKKTSRKSNDSAIYILLIVLMIAPFIIFLILGINLFTAICWAWAVINLFFWIIAPFVYKGTPDANASDNIVFPLNVILGFIIGVIIRSCAGY